MSTIADRLSDIVSYIETELAWSLPVIDKGREIIFFYEEEETGTKRYTIPEIRYVVYRDISNGKIEKHNAGAIIPKDLTSRIADGIYRYPSDTREEIRKEDEYLELYEEIVNDATLNNPMDNAKIKRLTELFGQLEQTEPVREIYLYLAKDFFKEQD